VSGGAAAAAAVAQLDADVALMDFRLPDIDGAEATSAVLAARPGTAVLCLTAEATEEERDAVLAAGAVGFVEKAEPIENLVQAIRSAAEEER
jgi:DNA-binding NarL/FixJ family response regulator